jgi:Arc/MetJ-type ribon-helix-helix transcriptional regulator
MLEDMNAQPLSPQTEQFIAEALSAGAFPSRESLLDAAVAELRATRAEEAESLRRCDEAIDSLEAGKGIDMTPERWDELARRVLQAAEADRLQANQ